MASCSCSSLALPELSFLSSRYHLSLSKQSLYRNSLYKNYPRCNLGRRIRVGAEKEDVSVVVEEKREAELIKRLNDLEFNGNGSASRSDSVGSVNGNGYANGSLVKYVNGNGNGNGVAVEVAGEVEEEKKLNKEDERKKKVEEIGKEEAWFKKSGQEKVEV